MSHAPDSTAHPRSEDDRVDSRAVVLVGVGALVTFLVASLAAMAYIRMEARSRPAADLPPEVGGTKIGLVEQAPFSDAVALRGEKDRAARRARLEGLGWVDRPHGVAHIPIEEAMALVAAGARPPPGDPALTPPLGAAHGGVDAPSVPIAAPPATPPKGAGAPARGGTR